jgi:hypothetical protein
MGGPLAETLTERDILAKDRTTVLSASVKEGPPSVGLINALPPNRTAVRFEIME